MILRLWRAFSALPRGWHYLAGLIAAVALLGALWAYLAARENADDNHNQQIGRDVQRAEDLAETLDRVEQSNETRDQVGRDLAAGGSDELYCNCLRTARTTANCVRFMRSREAPDCRTGAGDGGR